MEFDFVLWIVGFFIGSAILQLGSAVRDVARAIEKLEGKKHEPTV